MKNPLEKKSVQLWLKALRSGKYKQTKYNLKRGNKYCCLGVACVLYNKTHLNKINFTQIIDGELSKKNEKLPLKVMKWLGLSSQGGKYINYENNKVELSLWFLNDNDVTFNEIADLIESRPKGLFI